MIRKLQRAEKACALLIYNALPLLHELHWLPVSQRIMFKILLLGFKAIYGKIPCYIIIGPLHIIIIGPLHIISPIHYNLIRNKSGDLVTVRDSIGPVGLFKFKLDPFFVLLMDFFSI